MGLYLASIEGKRWVEGNRSSKGVQETSPRSLKSFKIPKVPRCPDAPMLPNPWTPRLPNPQTPEARISTRGVDLGKRRSGLERPTDFVASWPTISNLFWNVSIIDLSTLESKKAKKHTFHFPKKRDSGQRAKCALAILVAVLYSQISFVCFHNCFFQRAQGMEWLESK